MPARNVVKKYHCNAFYHVYNRGVEKKNIFLSDRDYRVLLFYFKIYLSPINEIEEIIQHNQLLATQTKLDSLARAKLNSFFGKTQLHCFVLMPNHFHLIIKQSDKHDMQKFMQVIFTKYSMYFNNQYDRVGGLFQGVYKAKYISKEEYFYHLSRYIHLNPEELGVGSDEYPYSSGRYYVKKELSIPHWLTTDFLLEHFKEHKNYCDFVKSETDLKIIKNVLIDEPKIKVSPF